MRSRAIILPMGKREDNFILIVLSAGWPDGFSEIVARESQVIAVKSGPPRGKLVKDGTSKIREIDYGRS